MLYRIGYPVHHSIFGKGKIVSEGFEKDSYRVEFEKSFDGMKTRTVRKDNLRLYI